MNRNDDTIFHSRFSLAEQLFCAGFRRKRKETEENTDCIFLKKQKTEPAPETENRFLKTAVAQKIPVTG
ncbi:hypothetical protein [Ruminobacter sp.]|uniref:hypothetical protein n=1 Tax=Ruminobacter sp. TaxID=2774296 RepID=UPI0038679E21